MPTTENNNGNTYTKKDLLVHLRVLQTQLYSRKVVARVQPLSEAQRTEFVAARLLLDRAITDLNTSLMRDIRTALEQQSSSLRAGLADLNQSLTELKGAVTWAKTVNGVIGVLAKIVPFL